MTAERDDVIPASVSVCCMCGRERDAAKRLGDVEHWTCPKHGSRTPDSGSGTRGTTAATRSASGEWTNVT